MGDIPSMIGAATGAQSRQSAVARDICTGGPTASMIIDIDDGDF
jgi:hypothetical protein